MAGDFVSGFGNSLIYGGSFADAFGGGITSGFTGGLTGGLVGGLMSVCT